MPILNGLLTLLLFSGVFFWISLCISRQTAGELEQGWRWLEWRPLPGDLPAWMFTAFLGSFLLQLILGAGLSLAGGMESAPMLPVVLFSILSFQGVLAGVMLLRLHRARIPIEEVCGLRHPFTRRDLVWGLVGLCLALPVVALSVLVTKGLFASAGRELNLQPMVEQLGGVEGGWQWAALFLLVGFIGPLLEEVVFRGFLFTWLSQRWGRWRGLALQALVFSVIHQHLASGLTLMVLAVVLGLLYVYTRRLMVCVWTHALFNSMTLVNAMVAGTEGML